MSWTREDTRSVFDEQQVKMGDVIVHQNDYYNVVHVKKVILLAETILKSGEIIEKEFSPQDADDISIYFRKDEGKMSGKVVLTKMETELIIDPERIGSGDVIEFTLRHPKSLFKMIEKRHCGIVKEVSRKHIIVRERADREGLMDYNDWVLDIDRLDFHNIEIVKKAEK